MKTTLKIIRIGNSKGVIIPSHILDNLDLDVGDLIEIKINEDKIKKA